MGFYEDLGKKSKEEKRKDAQQRGGFEDEGSRYRGKGTEGYAPRGRAVGSGAPQGAAPRGRSGAPKGDRPYGQRPSGDRPSGDRPYGRPAGERGNGDRPARSFSAAPKGAPQGAAPRGKSGAGDRPYGQRSDADRQGGQRYGQRPSGDRPYGERPAYSQPSGQRGGSRKQDNSFRFAKDAGQRYSDRGAGTSPRPYDEQRGARRQSAPVPHSRQYAPRVDRPSSSKEYQGAEVYRYEAPAAYDSPVNSEPTDIVPLENLLSGRNPIREALKSGRDIEKMLVARGELSGSAREIVKMAKEKHIPVQEVDRSRLDAITRNHQGMLAFASAYQYHTVEDMLALAAERNEEPFLVLLDGITDPHNLGAVIRTAECAGVHGVIVHERRAVGLTPAAVKASAGAVEYIPVARVTNLTNTLSELKAKNIWTFAADMEGEDYAKTDFSGPLVLVVGAEGEGVSRRVLDTCDKRVALPIRGKLDSLNASVAAGILLYAAMRAR